MCRVCCEGGEVVYPTRSPRQSRELGTSWTRKVVGKAARSAVREFWDGVNFGLGEEKIGSHLPSPAVVLLEVVGDV